MKNREYLKYAIAAYTMKYSDCLCCIIDEGLEAWEHQPFPGLLPRLWGLRYSDRVLLKGKSVRPAPQSRREAGLDVQVFTSAGSHKGKWHIKPTFKTSHVPMNSRATAAFSEGYWGGIPQFLSKNVILGDHNTTRHNNTIIIKSFHYLIYHKQ